MVLDDWQRGRLPYYSDPELAYNLKKPEVSKEKQAENEKKEQDDYFKHNKRHLDNENIKKATEKRILIESQLVIDGQKFEDLREKQFTEGFKNVEEPVPAEKNSDDEDNDDSDAESIDSNGVLQMDDSVNPIDANDEIDATQSQMTVTEMQESELDRLQKKFNMIQKKNKIIDNSRVEVMEKTRKTAGYQEMIDAAYGAKKYAKNSDRGNIDIKTSEKRARKMARQITGDVQRSGRPDKKKAKKEE